MGFGNMGGRMGGGMYKILSRDNGPVFSRVFALSICFLFLIK